MKRWCTLLAIALGPSIIALAYALLVQNHTAAYNTYVNEYRKWPWRAGVYHYISTCPNEWPHAGNSWADDIDVAGSFPVHAVSGGTITRRQWDTVGSGGNILFYGDAKLSEGCSDSDIATVYQILKTITPY
jgi:hypothetical protein